MERQAAIDRTGVAQRLPEALFVIDDRQRIVQWSDAATAVFGTPEQTTIGRSCHEVVRGRDPFGRAVCRPGCHPVQALREGQLIARCSLRVAVGDGPQKRFSCALVALPDGTAGAIATVSERMSKPPTPSDDTPEASVHGAFGGSAAELMEDLALVATLSTSMSPDHLDRSMQQALSSICQATGAEVAELFLAEPGGGHLLLTAHSGPFKAAFSQITRFRSGEGFPGIVQASGQPIVTADLLSEPSYLRTHVKEKGFLSYVCVPLRGSSDLLGVINVASRRPDLELDRVRRLLTWVSQPVTAVLQAGLLRVRETVGADLATLSRHPERDFDGFLRTVLQQAMLIAGAAVGTLILYDRDVRGVVRKVTGGEFSGVICPAVQLGNPQDCPALSGEHGIALYGPRRRWPQQCRQVPAAASLVYCLPLVAEGAEVGIIQLGYARPAPSPPTKHLAVLLNFAERAAETIRQAWAAAKPRPAPPDLGAAERETGPATALAPTSPRSAAAETRLPAIAPVLSIRAFGTFELHLQGKLVTPEMFGRRGALTLLKILLVRVGRPVAREELMELLWPESEPRAAANRLYVLMHALRRVIEPSRHDRNWLFVRNDGGNYYLDPASPLRLDITEFRRYVRLGEQLSRDGDETAAIQAFEAAVDLYRGDLLEDEPYADWCWEPRADLREICLTVLGRLASAHLDRGATEDSIERYRHALKIDPMRELNHRGLMRALWTAGRRDEALREYETCRDILRRELDVGPLPETEELHRLIRSSSGR